MVDRLETKLEGSEVSMREVPDLSLNAKAEELWRMVDAEISRPGIDPAPYVEPVPIRNHCELKRPTVADVIAFLSRYDPSTPFRMEDGDTGFPILDIQAWEKNGKLWFAGAYVKDSDG